jgi:hypothetical protein
MVKDLLSGFHTPVGTVGKFSIKSHSGGGREAGGGGSSLDGKRSRVCGFITVVPITKPFAWGEGDIGGHVLRETTIRGLCGLVCPSHTSERSVS